MPARFFESLTRVAPVGIYRTDANGKCIYQNERWTEISGLSASRSRGDGWADAIHLDDRPGVLDAWRACAAEGSEYDIEYRILRPSGDVRFVHSRGVPVFIKAGHFGGHVGTVEDITERRAAERELRVSVAALEFSRRGLQALFEYSLDGIVLTDDTARYVEANPAACNLFGLTREEVLTKRVLDMTAPEYRDDFNRVWETFLRCGELTGEYIVRRPDAAERDVEFRAVAHILPGTHLSIVRDVTERRKADRAQQQYVQRLEILSAIDRAILDADSPLSIANAAVEHIGRLFPAVRVSVLLVDRAAGTLEALAVWSREATRVDVGTSSPVRDDIAGIEVLEGRPVLVRDLAQAPGTSWIDQTLLQEGVRSIVRVPLRTKTDIIGALNISSNVPNRFNSEHVDVAQEVADRLAVAINNARLFEAVSLANAGLSVMSKRLLQVQEAERRDIARELHDEIGQVLTGLKLRLEIMNRAPELNEAIEVENLALVDDLIAAVRRLSLTLRPPLLDDFGLKRALVGHFDRMYAQTGLNVAFSSEGLMDQRFGLDVETAAFRIVQESLTNVARHAATSRAKVDVRVTSAGIDVVVSDSGCGFVGDAPGSSHGAGLSGMRERVVLLGGTFRIVSAEGKGTTITAHIHLTQGPLQG